MDFRKIVFIPSADNLQQAGVLRLRQLVAPHTEVEVFEPVYDPHLEALPARDISRLEALRDGIVEERLRRAEALAEALRGLDINASAAATWDYPLFECVVRRVLETDADLVVTEPLSGRAGALSNSDWRLISASPASVLLVNTDGQKKYENIVAAVDPFHAHAKPAELDSEILDQATAVETLTGATLSVVHCFLPLTSVASGLVAEHLPIDDAEAELERFRRDKVNELVADAGLDSSIAKLVRGRPADKLLDLAASGEADLIVMGALSRGRLRDLILGSTAERLVNQVHADVLIVKPPGFETSVGDTVRDELLLSPIQYPF
ncbi:MAG: universal stress protein [Gammaproteobacteria bacterium]|nr:universal stress protein [Gammaproteobacteria bacterium]